VIITELVEESDVDIHCLTEEGSTPLHLAALNGHTECVLRLLAYGAAINALDMVAPLSSLPLLNPSLNQSTYFNESHTDRGVAHLFIWRA
jgi:ankyrin repeat protein